MKKLTVMVSIYKSGRWIQNRLDNLLASSLINDMEIWCVNANSPDQLDHDIPYDYSHKHNNIIYEMLPKTINVYATWNYIISKSQSKYITNANTDDLISPIGYETLCAALENTDCDFAYPSWYTTAKENQKIWPPIEVDYGGKPGHFTGDIGRAGVGHFPMWRRSLHTSLGLFDDSFEALADADWWSRCAILHKAKFMWINEYLACYLWKDGSNGTKNLWHDKINSDEWHKFHTKVSGYKNGNRY